MLAFFLETKVSVFAFFYRTEIECETKTITKARDQPEKDIHTKGKEAERDSSSVESPYKRKRGRRSTDTVHDVGAASDVEEEEPFTYELYSVLVHSGSAIGGHYYAFIKSFEKDKW